MITKLSILVPVFNEVATAERLLRRVAAVRFPIDREIIVVDDGSTDGTADEARAAGARVLSHATNRGYGAALKTGIRQARHELIGITDADGTYPAESIPALVEQLIRDGNDMVVAARTGESVVMPLVRRPAKWGLRQLAKLVAGEPIADLNSGLRIFRRGWYCDSSVSCRKAFPSPRPSLWPC